MRRRVSAAALLALTAAVAVFAGARVKSAEGALSDRELARVFGGGNSVGCVVLPDLEQPAECKGTSFVCPQAPCYAVYNQAPAACNTKGTWYSNVKVHALGGPDSPANTRIPLYNKVDCNAPAFCKAWPVQPNAKCDATGACTGVFFKYQCQPCSTQYGVTVQYNGDGYCQDP